MHVFCSKLENLKDVELAVTEELKLTHPRTIVHKAGVCLALAVRFLVQNKGDMKGAYKHVEDYIEKEIGNK